MTLLFTVLALWLLASVLTGVLVGKWLAWNARPVDPHAPACEESLRWSVAQ